MLLVGDIGGTNGRFALVEQGSTRPIEIDVEPAEAHATFEDALGAYLSRLGETPRRAAFAVAGPLDADGRGRITNRPAWRIDPESLRRRFGFEQALTLNDFVAQAASLPHLEAGEQTPIGDVRPTEATKAALGPGTGLGVAALVREDGGGWLPLPSEGGHVGLAAGDQREAAAIERVRAKAGRVEAETLLSGKGLPLLHAALGELDGRPAEGDAGTPEIVDRALAREPAAAETARVFLTMLARFAGDMALVFGARGGVYLCGGVTPRLLPVIDAPAFRAAFEAKAPHEAMMREIATMLVTSPVAGLVGCAAYAQRSGG